MVNEILKFTKITFLIHLIIGGLFTILYWMPSVLATLFSLTFDEMSTALCHIIAALFTGLVATSLFGFMAKEWKEVKIVVINELLWLITGLIAAIINFAVIGIAAILFIVIFIFLLVIFLITFLQQEEIIGVIIGK